MSPPIDALLARARRRWPTRWEGRSGVGVGGGAFDDVAAIVGAAASVARRGAYALRATSVVLLGEDGGYLSHVVAPDGTFRLRVTYLFRCAIPLASAIVCRAFADLDETAREDLAMNPRNDVFGALTPGRYVALSAEAEGRIAR